MKKALLKYTLKVKQYLCLHNLTTPFKERGEVDPKMVEEIGAWNAYVLDNRMFCKKCGYIPKVTNRFIATAKEIDKKNLTDKEKMVESIMTSITTPPFEKY